MAPYRAVAGVLLFCATIFLFGSALRAEDVTVDVQAVAASDPGQKVSIPAALKQYEAQLKENPFGTFTDAGHDSVKAAVGGAAGTSTLAGFAIEVAVLSKLEKGRSKVQITIKQNGKAIGPPLKTDVSRGKSMMMKAGDPNAPKIFLFTLKDE